MNVDFAHETITHGSGISEMRIQMMFLKILPKKKKNIHILHFSPFSPNFNPLKHILEVIKRIIKGRTFQNKQELKNEIQKIWNEFLQNSIDKLCLSF